MLKGIDSRQGKYLQGRGNALDVNKDKREWGDGPLNK